MRNITRRQLLRPWLARHSRQLHSRRGTNQVLRTRRGRSCDLISGGLGGLAVNGIPSRRIEDDDILDCLLFLFLRLIWVSSWLRLPVIGFLSGRSSSTFLGIKWLIGDGKLAEVLDHTTSFALMILLDL